jgi:predicted outer membrane repeat protein
MAFLFLGLQRPNRKTALIDSARSRRMTGDDNTQMTGVKAHPTTPVGLRPNYKRGIAAPLIALAVLFLASFSWAGPWNDFVYSYRNATGDITLEGDISTGQGDALAFYTTTGDNFTIDGGKHIVDAVSTQSGFILFGKTIAFKDISFKNFRSIEALIMVENSIIDFTGEVNFINTDSELEGSVFRDDIEYDSPNLINFNGTFNFISNNAGHGGGVFFLSKTIVSFENSISSFSNNTAANGDANGGVFLIDESAGGTISFRNSTSSFFDNKALYATVNNDIHLSNEKSFLFFDQENLLPNGIRISGHESAQIRKTGAGKVTFAGEGTIISNTFNLEQGSAVFQANQSTVAAINMTPSALTTLSLQSNSTNELFIKNPFILDGYLDLDFDFTNSLADFISVAGQITINADTILGVNIINGDPSTDGTLAFMQGVSITGSANLTLSSELTNYSITYLDGILSLVYAPPNPWDLFVSEYKSAQSFIELTENITATDDLALAFGNPDNAGESFTIEGGGFNINANGKPNLALSFNAKSITFRNISFTSFTANSHAATVIYATNSNLFFDNSIINFISNTNLNNQAGALNLYQSSGFFEKATVTFSSNSAGLNGGAIAIIKQLGTAFIRLSFNESKLEFIGNTSLANGGAISHVSNLGTTPLFYSFKSSVNFLSNNASQNGGAIIISRATATFENSKFDFTNNNAGQLGGAIFVEAISLLTIKNSAVSFINNATNSNGGALYMQQSTISFINALVNFNSNNATNKGGAIYTDQSWISFTNSKINLSNNIAQQSQSGEGGGIHVENSTASFKNSIINFAYNEANYAAGIFIKNSFISFVDSTMNFIANISQMTGGAVVIGINSTLSFTNSSATFINNVSALGGAAIAGQDNTIVAFTNSTVSFINNTVSNAMGGAIVIAINVNIPFENSKINFTNNSAPNSDGGAIYAMMDTNTSFENSNISFSNNIAGGNGGAIYTNMASIISFTNSVITFKGNLANGNKNDIYLGDADSNLIFDQDNLLPNGIRSAGAGIIKKTGSGQVIFAGDDTIIENTFNLEQGKAVFLANQSSVTALTMSAGTTLSLSDVNSPFVKRGTRMGSEGDFAVNAAGVIAGSDPQSLFILSAFTLNGTLTIDFDFNFNRSDFLFANGGITINSDSTLNVNLINPARIHGSSLPFMQALSTISYSESFFANLPTNYEINYSNDDNTLWLHYFGADIINSITGLGDTYNEKQTEKVLERMRQNGDDRLLEEVYAVMERSGSNEARKGLDMLSGEFLAELLVMTALDNNSNSLYAKLNSPFVKRGTRMGSEGDFAVASKGDDARQIAGQARNDAERGVVIAGSDPQSYA